jgi:hypothetical protein
VFRLQCPTKVSRHHQRPHAFALVSDETRLKESSEILINRRDLEPVSRRGSTEAGELEGVVAREIDKNHKSPPGGCRFQSQGPSGEFVPPCWQLPLRAESSAIWPLSLFVGPVRALRIADGRPFLVKLGVNGTAVARR